MYPGKAPTSDKPRGPPGVRESIHRRIIQVCPRVCQDEMTEIGYEVLVAITEDIVLRIHQTAGSQEAGRHRGIAVRSRAGFKRLVEDIREWGRGRGDCPAAIAMICHY